MAGAYRVCHVHQSICHTMCLAQFQKKLFQDIFIKPLILIIQCRYFSNDQTLGDIQVDMITYERYNYRKVGKRYLISYTEKPIPYFLHRKLMPYFLHRKIIPYFLHSVESCSCDLLNQECMMLFLHFQCFCLWYLIYKWTLLANSHR